MCSISGVFIAERPPVQASLILSRVILDTIIRAEERGRDSWGVTTITQLGGVSEWKSVGKPSDGVKKLPAIVRPETRIVINNNRAEPTTEWTPNKTRADIQPFRHGDWIVAHNGTIANDRELAERYGVTPLSKIDTAVIPAILHAMGKRVTREWLQTFLRDEVIGSYAIAIANATRPYELFLACNYKPLYLTHYRKHNAIVFTSLESYTGSEGLHQRIHGPNIVAIPPYTLVHLTAQSPIGQYVQIHEYSLRQIRETKKALVVCSGGLDSVVAATEKIQQGYEVTLLHFLYQCRAEKREVEAIIKIADWLRCRPLLVPTAIFKDVIKGSRLTNTKEALVTDREGAASAEFAHEWVPARNLIMLSIATGIAEAQGHDTIVLGNNLEEGGAYPDNEMEFINRLNTVMPYATNLHHYVNIEMPVGNLMKHEIVKRGLALHAPLHLTWSCLESNTLVRGLRGDIPISQILPNEWVWGWDKQWIPTRVERCFMQGVKPVFEVTLADGVGKLTTVVATADHRFLKRDGDYVPLEELRVGDRLMPSNFYAGTPVRDQTYALLRRRNVANEAPAFAHRIVAEYFGIHGEVVHHIDGDLRNNSRENLVGMSRGEHSRLEMLGRKLPEKTRATRTRLSTWWKELTPMQYEAQRQKISDGRRRQLNHRVVSIRPIGTRVTYDIQTGTRNFALAAGVFVHNCYEGGETHCGICGPCFMRKAAFKMSGVFDPVFLHEVGDKYWEGCVQYIPPSSSQQ